MSATILKLADAIVTELNGGTFSQSFTAQRHYQPIFELPDMSQLHVSVVPLALSSQQVSRSKTANQYQVDIGIQQKGDMSQVWLDGLMQLVEEMADFLQARSLAGFPQARCLDVTNAPVYALEHLEELRQFTSVLTATYQVEK
jgi:hypothetical protein